jgi:hypothetical protein
MLSLILLPREVLHLVSFCFYFQCCVWFAAPQTQINKGYEILMKLKDALAAAAPQKELEALTSRFYTIIPHSFGRSRGPVIDSEALLRQKIELCGAPTLHRQLWGQDPRVPHILT